MLWDALDDVGTVVDYGVVALLWCVFDAREE